MTTSIIDNVKEYIRDCIRYFDTAIPKDVDSEKYIYLKYTSREKQREFMKQHEDIDERVLHHVALIDFLHNDEDYVLRRCQAFYDKPLRKVVRDHE